jgi:hypothetical protein
MQAWLSFPFGETRRGPDVLHPENKPAADTAADAARNALLFIDAILIPPFLL